jgi:hypothetical protein
MVRVPPKAEVVSSNLAGSASISTASKHDGDNPASPRPFLPAQCDLDPGRRGASPPLGLSGEQRVYRSQMRRGPPS